MKKTAIIIIIFASLLGGSAYAGSTASGFLNNPVSVRSLALGNCSAAQVDSASFYKNPASIKANKNQSINVFQGKVLSDVNYLSINYTKPNLQPNQYGMGFSLIQAGIEGIQESTYDALTGTAELTGNKFSYIGRAYIFSISKDIAENFFVGTNIKYLQESMASESSSGAGLDLGLFALINDKLSFGLSAINIVKPQLRWSTGTTEPLDGRYVTGFSYQYDKSLQLFTDVEKVADQPAKLIMGAEYKIFSICSFRAGYHNSQLSIGTGLEYNNIGIDYAYVDNQDKDIGTTQYISVSLLMNEKTEPVKQEQKPKNDKALKDAISEEKLKDELKAPEVLPTLNIPNLPVTKAAEIKPLPLPKPEEKPIEQVSINVPVIPTNSKEVVPEEIVEIIESAEIVEPIIDTSPKTEIELTINIQDEPQEPVYDYNIAMLTARYYETAKLQCKVFVDNTGNQNDTVAVNFRILNNEQKEITAFAPKKSDITANNNFVYYFIYENGKPLPAGRYYIETKTESSSTTKYQKELYIKRQ